MENTNASKQEFWLNHIRQAQEQKLTLAAYAKQHNLSDKNIYRWKTVLTQRGLLLSEKPKTSFARVKQVTEKTDTSLPIEILLANGHRVQVAAVNQQTLIALINELRND